MVNKYNLTEKWVVFASCRWISQALPPNQGCDYDSSLSPTGTTHLHISFSRTINNNSKYLCTLFFSVN